MLKLQLAKLISENYYQKLLDNISNDFYSKNINVLNILSNVDHNNNYNMSDDEKDIIKKINNLLYNDVLNKDYKKVNDYINKHYIDLYSKNILNNLIKEGRYEILSDILVSNPKDLKNNLMYFLKLEVYPEYNTYFNYLTTNKNNLKLLNKICNVNQENKNTITNEYVYNLVNTIFYNGINDIYVRDLETLEDKYNVFNLLINKLIENNPIVNKDNLKEYTKFLIDFYKDESSTTELKGVFLLSMLNYMGIDKYNQYELLTKNLKQDDQIFKTFMVEAINFDSFFYKNNYIYLNDENIININHLDDKKIDLLIELFDTIKNEPNINNQNIMFNKIKDSFKIYDNGFNLDNLNDIKIVKSKDIELLTKEQFDTIYISLEEQRLIEFDSKLKDI